MRARPALLLAAAAIGASLAAVPVAEARRAVDPEPTEPVAVAFARGTFARAALAESVPFVGAPTLWAGGHTGSGKVIAVIDTGVDADFGGTLVGEACFAATAIPGSNDLIGHCGPSANEEQAFSATCFVVGVCDPGDPYYVPDVAAARPCPSPPASRPSACAHGSAVAAVAARHDAPQGMAPDAAVYAIRVFNPQGTSADLVDIYYALDHVVRLADAGLDIAATNLSVATGSLFAGVCDSSATLEGAGPVFADVLRRLRDRGIVTTIASGNDGVSGEIAFPACISTGVSVAASDLDDDISPFSNTGPGLDLLAPGSDDGSSPLNIPSGTGFSQWSGTSFAAPHVAGAFALLTDLYPKASVTQLVGLLRDNGVPVLDGGVTYKRLALEAPAQALNAGILFPTSASFAASSRVAVGDLDGDGHDDVLAHVPGSGSDRIAYGRTDWLLDVRSYAVNGTYTPLVGSFRGVASGPDDVLWYGVGSAADAFWTGQSNRQPTGSPLSINGTYAPRIGDFDGDGWDDVFWYAAGATGDYVWYGGPGGFTSKAVSATGTWRVVVGDFNGDGRDDLLFHAPGGASDAVWRGTATRGSFAKSAVTLTSSFMPVVANVDGDLDDDVVLYQPGAGSDYLWRGGSGVGGAGVAGGFAQSTVSINGTYTPSVGDLDGDGDDEVLWYAAGSASDMIWFGKPAGTPTSRLVTINGTYTVLAGDLDADDGEELVFVSKTSSTTPIWWSHTP